MLQMQYAHRGNKYCTLYTRVSSKFEKLEFFESMLDVTLQARYMFLIYIVKNSVISPAVLVQDALRSRAAYTRLTGLIAQFLQYK